MNKQLKDLFIAIANLVDEWAQSVGLSATDGKIAKSDLLNFYMYLSASDGTIDWDEAHEISEVMDFDRTDPQVIKEVIDENNIYSKSFESTVPFSFMAAVGVDNYEFEKEQVDLEYPCALSLLYIYKDAGKNLIQVDNDVNPNEVRDYNIYINMLENYIKQNDKLVSNNMSDDETSDVSEEMPIKHGVAAPKKR